MFIVNHRRIFFVISLLLVLGSLGAIWRLGLNFGTDFTGGAIAEVNYGTLDGATATQVPSVEVVRQAVNALDFGDAVVQAAGPGAYLLRLPTLDEAEHQTLLATLDELTPPGGTFTETRFSSVGPALGAELARKGIIAIVIVVFLILIYIAFVFRQVSRPVSSWIYGLVVIIMMFHDVLIPTGIFALLGHYYGVSIDALFLTAFLTILGLSVNDKIVALDRIRENLRRHGGESFPAVVGRSLRETLTRSVNTSVTIIITLLAVYFLGSETTRWFALAMALGMLVATYSSIFVAAPLLVSWAGRRR
jgi:preprotein translocase subunit SecF